MKGKTEMVRMDNLIISPLLKERIDAASRAWVEWRAENGVAEEPGQYDITAILAQHEQASNIDRHGRFSLVETGAGTVIALSPFAGRDEDIPCVLLLPEEYQW